MNDFPESVSPAVHAGPADAAALAALELQVWPDGSYPAVGLESMEARTQALDEVLKDWGRPRVEAVLALLQARLGGAGERSYDLELARAVAHRLNNAIVAERLQQALRAAQAAQAEIARGNFPRPIESV